MTKTSSPTNRMWWKKTKIGYPTTIETVLGETRIDGHNCALIKVDDDGCSSWPYIKQVLYVAIVDISEYRNCYPHVWRRQDLVINVSEFGEVGLSFSNCSPSLWDNGFGICYYARTTLFEVSKKDFTQSWMRFSLKSGITEGNFGTTFEKKIARDVICGMAPVFNVFDTCGKPKLVPVVDDF